MKRKTNYRPVKYNLRSARIAPELDDFIRNMQEELKRQTGLRKIPYSDVSFKVADLAKEAHERRKKKKGKGFELKFDTKI